MGFFLSFQLKWHRTRNMYIAYCINFLIMVLSLMGFALTHYGEYAKIVSESNKIFWWYFYESMTIYYSIYYIITMFDVHKWMKSLLTNSDTKNLKSAVKRHLGKLSECLLTIADLCVAIAVLIFPYLVLFTNFFSSTYKQERHLHTYYTSCVSDTLLHFTRTTYSLHIA